jgi:hypothetical protein
MSQNDFTLANQSFPAFRADLNSALQALATNNSGGSAPSTTFANMWWYDTSNNIMYIRNEDNDAWIKFAELDQANDKFVLSGTLQLDDGTVSAPALTFNSDTNMGIYRGGTDILKFVTAGTDAITIDASQNVDVAGDLTVDTYTLYVDSTNNRVGIGTSSLTSKFEVAVSDNTAIQEAITIKGTQTGAYGGYLGWKDNWSGDSYTGYRGAIISDVPSANNGRMKFFIADSGSLSQAMTLDSSGNLLVGTTNSVPGAGNTAVGTSIYNDGRIFLSKSANTVASFNRNTSDGAIAEFRKDGTTVGSIGVASSDLTIFSSTGNHKGLRFGNGQIVPTNNAGADSDNTTDLGGNSNRFKDLYLSGGLVLDDNPTAVGGSVTSKTLDDYEEGTWTPAIYYQNADDLTNSTNVTQSGMYTKIGNIVQATCYLKWSATDARANDNIGVSGFPFTASNSAPSSETRWIAPMVYQNTSYSTSSAQIFTTLSNNATISNFVTAHGTGNLGDDFGQNTNMIVKFTLTYHTNQ